MVAFLEKHFEFTTHLPMEECVARLRAKSKRGYGLLASRRDILVRISEPVYGTSFWLTRDVGWGGYAEVSGQFIDTKEGIWIKGYGRVPLVVLIVMVWPFLVISFFVYAFSGLPWIPLIVFAGAIMSLIFLKVILKNRDDLVALVKQTLEANEQ